MEIGGAPSDIKKPILSDGLSFVISASPFYLSLTFLHRCPRVAHEVRKEDEL